MAANIKRVALVFGSGSKTRVAPVQVKGGSVSSGTINQVMKSGEQLLGVIGHYKGELSPKDALKILEARVDVSRFRVADFNLGLLFDPNSNRVAMKGQVTIGQVKQFVGDTGYKAAGHNADEFNQLVAAGDVSGIMVYTNKADCLAFIKWSLPIVQARDARIETLGLPSVKEWLEMRQIFSQLTGKFWERLSDGYFRSFRRGDHSYFCDFPGCRYNSSAFRLVGTYKKS